MWRHAARSMLGTAAAAFDRAANTAVQLQTARARRNSRAESLGHAERMAALAAIAAVYSQDVVASYFREPRTIEPTVERVRPSSAKARRAVDIRWPSDYEALLPGVRARYHAKVENRDAAARLILHDDEPRPAMILIHGYMAGAHGFEERVWPTAWLHAIGLDLALFVLPFHGVRAVRGRRGPPPFPGSDPRVSNEGFRQAIGDLRDLAAWLRGRGHRAVGVMGMSLGGYTASLACTVEPAFDFAVPVIPLTSLADFARDQGRLGTNAAEAELEHGALDRVHRLVSPLHRAPLVAPERVLIIAAEADRITPLAHARRLAAHFGAPLETWHGGHILQFGRGEKFRKVGRLLGDLGLLDDHPRAGP